MAEQYSRKTQRLALVWGLVAVGGFVGSTLVDPLNKSIFDFARWVSLVIALLYAGRWIQCHRMEQWLRSRFASEAEDAEAGTPSSSGPDWSHLPRASRLAVRSYSSVEEALANGWSFGKTKAHYEDRPVPEWAMYEGDRFGFDGLDAGMTAGVVPENVRLFGRLRYKREILAPIPA